ncbi:hypothetical protein LOK74_20590 [Brevibacillus humidisoli]|uniref:hypothetical protein n=1 Tax=Brevibacillus humidisoli TaxID=2895522 RepID=UPI001E3B74F1|nr:hypothetical protein [Brevibacillus humidisoli]UFJ40402.1 hypothetical protein LOK74_20590 [Brevibacillus humidisoli]
MLQLVKERKNIAEQVSEMANPVEALWEVELLYGKHPAYTENTYAVKFTTKLEGHASKCFLVIDLRDRFDEFLRDLNVFGSMEKVELHQTIDYVKYLKINGIFRRVPNLLSEMEGSAGADESLELFSLVADAVLSEPDAFPTVSSDAYKNGVSSGVILDSEQYAEKYGENAVGITTEALLEILDLDGGTRDARFKEIARGWLEQGLLLKRSNQVYLASRKCTAWQLKMHTCQPGYHRFISESL